MTVTELEPPTSDGHFLQQLQEYADQLRADGDRAQEFASTLTGMHMPSSVTGEVHAIAEELAQAAQHAVRAGSQFEQHFEEARAIAGRGMHIRGEDAA